jgi:hypothetical protein
VAGTVLPLAFSALWMVIAFAGDVADGARESAPPAAVAKGEWGGAHVRLVVSEGGGRLEFDCAGGTIDGPLVVDEHGDFEAHGAYLPEFGGPVRAGDQPAPGRAATYRGSVDGTSMRLAVTLAGDREEIGRFSLRFGERPLLEKCL